MISTLHILYAEDNTQDADLTQTHFAEHASDFEVEIVTTGQACLARLKHNTYDLLLLDHHLPDMEGLDVLKALLHMEVRVPVVLVTGVGDETLVVRALRLGADNYVPKLGNYLETLPPLLRRVIEEHRLRQSQGLLSSVSRRILYVEHNLMDIELALRHFAETAPHFEFDVVHTCQEALARLARPPAYDAALIDLRMPEQSGLEFATEAKRRGLPLPPFIMISGMGDEAAAIASLKLGAADYVAKREGYLDQLPITLERAIAHERLDRLSEQLQAELAEHRLAEEMLNFRNVILSTQQETSMDGILVVDGNGRVVSSNQRFAMMWCVPAEIIESKSEERILQSMMERLANPEEFLSKVKALNAAHDTKSQDEIVLKDGCTFERYSAPMVDTDGKYVGRVWYFRNITARKQAEAERDKFEEQFRMSQKLEAIGSLAGGIAHDFNNLLSVILGFTECAMEEAQEGDRQWDALLEVKKAGERAVALTRQLLAFSRKQMLQPVLLDLNQIAAGVEKMLRRILGEDIDYIQVLAPALGKVRADPGQIEQVLMNLVVNARDAMPKGGKLTIETSNVELDEEYGSHHVAVNPGPYVQLAITDTGCGMDAQTRARVFEPFFTTKGVGKGSGLGLSMVYGIVKQSGGNIWVYSELGYGTTFKIYLPRVLASDAPGPVVSALVTRTRGTETVLVVEDEQAVRELVKRILASAGYTVLTAATGSEALLVCESYPNIIHLVLTDVVMPQMGGKALAVRLATMRPGIKILYMSGYTDDAIVHHGTLDPGTQFIGKPFNAADLTKKVREVLDTEQPQAVAVDVEKKER
jgi:signal transduction histidine kinase/FixJ family two-component response regulator